VSAVSPLGEPRLIPVSRIRPYQANPRRRPDKAVEQVARSIREFGWQQPIVVDREMVIIIGHTRYHAAKHLGEKEAPVIVDDRLTPDQVRALRVVDNRTHDYTTWDYPLLISELDGLDELYAGVLDLADWQAIISQYEDAQAEAELGFDPETAAALAGEHTLTVTFVTRENADAAGPAILDLPGVTNVTYARK